MSPSSSPRQFAVQVDDVATWVALHPHREGTNAPLTQLFVDLLPPRLRWFLTQQYQVRLSWPAPVRGFEASNAATCRCFAGRADTHGCA